MSAPTRISRKWRISDMLARSVCAVIIPLREGETEPPQTTLGSVARADDGRVFSSLKVIAAPFAPSPAQMRNAAVARALDAGAEWIFILEDAQIHPDAFTCLAPALENYQAIWGALWLESQDNGMQIPKITRLACRDMPEFHHMALEWWVGRSHMLSARAARETCFKEPEGGGWYGDYLLRLWGRFKCLKTAQGLTIDTALTPVAEADKARLLDDLARERRFITFAYEGRQIKLAYSGRNPALEREQLRGLFYEQGDLNALRAHVKPGAVIVDVGANTGNHTVFFAAVLKAEKVIPIEPNPVSIGFLKAVVTANRLANVDLSRLGVGVGARLSSARLHTGRRGHLGTASLLAGDGDIPVRTLDTLIEERVDLLKIDVESMEVEVLEGARELIMRDRPLILVEVADENIMSFLDMTQKVGYKTEEIFADHGYSNYLLIPGAKAGHG